MKCYTLRVGTFIHVTFCSAFLNSALFPPRELPLTSERVNYVHLVSVQTDGVALNARQIIRY